MNPEDLTAPLDADAFHQFHEQLVRRLATVPGSLAVKRDAGGGKGKGLFALAPFQEGDQIFLDAPLVGEQHTANRPLGLACDQCFRHVGPLELQMGFRLLAARGASAVAGRAAALLRGEEWLPQVDWMPRAGAQLGPRSSAAVEPGRATGDKPELFALPLQLARLLEEHSARPAVPAGAEAIPATTAHARGAAGTALQQPARPASGHEAWPMRRSYDEQWAGAVYLPDSSAFLFCSHACAALAWTCWAAALSPGPARNPAWQPLWASPYLVPLDLARVPDAVLRACTMHGSLDTFHGLGSAEGQDGSCGVRPAWLPRPVAPEAAASAGVRAMFAHADRSNDAFRVAARATAAVVSDFHMRRALSALQRTPEPGAGARPGRCNPCGAGPAAVGAAVSGSTGGTNCSGAGGGLDEGGGVVPGRGRVGLCSSGDAPAGEPGEGQGVADNGWLREAWVPYRAVHWAVWWEHVPVPDGVRDEAEWRQDLRELAVEALTRLRIALPASTPPALLHERVWGSLLGRFELNNVALVVRSPLELFFLAVDDLPDEAGGREVRARTAPLLDALDADYDECLQGTALCSLHSCMNHGANPNVALVKEDHDVDGCVVVTAARDIQAGEELLTSYVDAAIAPAMRAAILREYGIEEDGEEA